MTLLPKAVVALVALGVGVVAGTSIASEAPAATPAIAQVAPAQLEVCGPPATVTAPVAVRPNELLTIRLVQVEHGHEHRIRMVTARRSGQTFTGSFAVPPVYDAPRSFTGPEPIIGDHIVRIERPGELLAVGRVTVLPEDPGTPTTCHSSAGT
jgi:hypothetical protein